MVNILFIVFEFPPYTAGGVHRPLRIINKLPEYGLNPVVITIDHERVYGKDKCDFYLNEKVRSGAEVYRTQYNHGGLKQRFIETGYSFEADVSYSGWRKYFKKEVALLIEKSKPQAVFVTLPPFSVGSLAIWVKEQFNIPLIVDMRDAWSNWIIAPYASYLHYLQIKRQEYRLLKSADAIMVTSPQTIKDFQKLYQDIPAHKYHFIPNGFEHYDAPGFSPLTAKEKIRIGYVGSFYYNPISQKLIDQPWFKKKLYQYFQYLPHKENWLYRSPYFFFKALNSLFKECPEYRAKIELVFAGSKPEWFEEMVAEFALSEVINHVGIISQKESMALQRSCDVLLITSAKLENGFDYSIAGKTFEYFSLRKPILGFVCPGSQKWILENSGLAILADPDDATQSVSQLKMLLDGKAQLTPNDEYIDQFRMENIMLKIQHVFKSLLNQ